MSELPTVLVRREGGKGYRLINAADFDPARHVRLDVDDMPGMHDIVPQAQFDDGACADGFMGAAPDYDAMTDSELRALIRERTGRHAGPRSSREKLIEAAKAAGGI